MAPLDPLALSGPIPDFQPIPFPAPVWLLTIFLVGGFYLHALPMNVALTGGIIAALFILYGKRRNHPYAQRLGGALAFSLPFFVSLAITQGIVPLLFIQLIYGPLFYTSSIVLGLPWILVIGMLLIAYYAYYVFTYRHHTLGKLGPAVLLLAGLLFLSVAFVFTNNTTLMLTPDRWAPLYRSSPSGVNLNLMEPQLLPRYLHFVVASIAVTGLAIGCFGLYWHRRETDYGTWLIRTGAGLYLVVTLLQVPIGIWFLISLPSFVMWNFLGREVVGTSLFAASMVLDLLGLLAMALAWREGSPRYFRIGLGTALVVILLMVIIRHMVRVYYTQGFFAPDRMPVDTQWVLLALFLGSFVAGVVYIGWLLRITWQAYETPIASRTD